MFICCKELPFPAVGRGMSIISSSLALSLPTSLKKIYPGLTHYKKQDPLCGQDRLRRQDMRNKQYDHLPYSFYRNIFEYKRVHRPRDPAAVGDPAREADPVFYNA